jgi:plasmid stabilization system protein ParE
VKRLRIRSEAKEEIDAAFEWYFKRSPKAADAFLEEIETSLKNIVSEPHLYPIFTKNIRRRVMTGFPYSVIFREEAGSILVIAIAHAKRRPGYWTKRLKQ